MWSIFGKRKTNAVAKEAEQTRKILASQNALLEAATSTADAAQHVTSQLKRHLEESIIQFETTIRILSDGLIVCDSKGNVKAFNPAAEKIFQLEATKVINTPVNELFRLDGNIPKDQQTLWEALQMEKDGNSPFAPLKGFKASGEDFPIEATMTRLDRADGSSIVLMLIRDMSDIYASIRDSEAHAHRYRSIFNLSFDGILIVQNDRVVAANESAGALFGKDPETLLAMNLTSLIDPATKLPIVPNDKTSPVMKAETIRQDGTMLQLLLSSADITWNDDPAQLLTVKNVSNMKEFHKTINNKKDISQDMIVCFTPEFIITFANVQYCNYFSKSSADLIGTDFRLMMSEAERKATMLKINELSPEHPSRRLQIYAPHTDGSIRLQDWIDHASYDENGNVLEYQRTGQDITNLLNLSN